MKKVSPRKLTFFAASILSAGSTESFQTTGKEIPVLTPAFPNGFSSFLLSTDPCTGRMFRLKILHNHLFSRNSPALSGFPRDRKRQKGFTGNLISSMPRTGPFQTFIPFHTTLSSALNACRNRPPRSLRVFRENTMNK